MRGRAGPWPERGREPGQTEWAETRVRGIWAGDSSWPRQPGHFLPVLVAPAPSPTLTEAPHPTPPRPGRAPASGVSSHHVILVFPRPCTLSRSQLALQTSPCPRSGFRKPESPPWVPMTTASHPSPSPTHSYIHSQGPLPSPTLSQSYHTWAQVKGSSWVSSLDLPPTHTHPLISFPAPQTGLLCNSQL